MARYSSDPGTVPPGQGWESDLPAEPAPDPSEAIREAFEEQAREAQPAAEPAAAPEPEDEYDDGFRFSDVFVERSPEEAAREERDRELAALHDGTAVNEAVESEAAADRAFAALRSRNPGLDSAEAIAAMRPALERIGERFGYGVAADPRVIERVYHEIGGPGAFEIPPEAEAWLEAAAPPAATAF